MAAQGGINAARARRVDGDQLARFVRDTVKGGDFRARESEAWRLGEESTRVIDHLNALGVPFAREYGGSLSTRSFGGVQVSRTYYSRGQTGQQLQVAASSALMRQVAAGHVALWVRHEVLDVLVRDGRACGVVTRDLTTGEIRVHRAHAVVMATGGYGNVYFHSTLAKNSNATAIWRAHRAGAAFASPSFIQFHPTALPVSTPWQSKTTLMSESLRNDGRIWVPREPGDDRPPSQIPEDERDYYLERKYPAFGNLTPRDVASRAARAEIDSGHGIGPLHNSVYLDFRDALARLGRDTIAERYGNLFTMYRDATGEDPYTRPMRIAPGAHFTMGGLWVDYRLMSTLPGLFVAGEANAAYHGANRLGANSLLAACVDGSFTIPRTVPDYLAGLLGQDLVDEGDPVVTSALERVAAREAALLAVHGGTPAKEFHRRLGEIMYRDCGVVRDRAGLERGISEIADLRREFHRDVRVSGVEGSTTRTWWRPGGSPTTSSWRSSCAWTPGTARSPAGRTSAPSTRTTGRHAATTRTGCSPRPGRPRAGRTVPDRGRAPSRTAPTTRSSSPSAAWGSPRGATHETRAGGVAPGRSGHGRGLRHLRRPRL